VKNRLLFAVAGAGVVASLISAMVLGKSQPAQPPLFTPAANPYAKGIYASGIVESYQSNGSDVAIFPEVSGRITHILVKEGDVVRAGTPLIEIEDSVPRATTDQLQAQADAAGAMLAELKSEPRKETLAVAQAQVDAARASLKTADDALARQDQSYKLDARSVSLTSLEAVQNAEKLAAANLKVAEQQYSLTQAGAWSYDIANQAHLFESLSKSAVAARATLTKYTITAPVDGVVLALQSTVGSYVSSQGAYDTFTEGYQPVVLMASDSSQLEVRTYVDEVLVHNLPDASKMKGEMSLPGTSVRIPLTFERMQPYVSPKIELSDQREERVDVRVLPVIFRFTKPSNVKLYPGQLVDVYIGQ
jgi:HlyD family secretion protein